MKDKKRPIRSFVRREGRMTLSQKASLEKYWSEYGLETEMGLIDINAVFGRESDVILEIGFGAGASLLEMAAANPQDDYIGIEVHRPGIGGLLSQMVKNDVTNIRLFQQDVMEVLRKSIPDTGLSKIQIFFPDPWHKKRHHKRRLIQPSFVELLRQKLKLGGQVHLATDWQNYAEYMMEVFSNDDNFNNLVGHGHYLKDSSQYRVTTKFERRGQRLGHRIWDMIFVRMI